MYKHWRIKRGIGLLAVFMILAGGFMWLRQAVYVNSLSTRPFEVAVLDPLDKLEPALLDNDSQEMAASAVYEGLISYDDQDGKLKPLLAEHWEYSGEGQSLTIELKKNIKFSNGKEVTAGAVKASWEKNIALNRDWYNQCMFFRIAGASEFINGSTPDISGIQAPDEHSLQITLLQPDGAFLYALTSPIFWVVDRSTEAPCGTGPFIIKESTAEKLLLVSKDEYHRGKPHLAAVNFIRYQDENQALAAYNEGKVDYLDVLPADEWANITGDSQYKGLFIDKPLMEVYWLGFNLTREPYNSSYLLRRALNYAIDRDAIIKNILGGSYMAAKGVIPVGCSAYNESMGGYTYDPDRAQQLLEEAGYPNGKGLKPLTLTCNRDPGHRQIALEVARQLGLQGITVQVQENDWDYFTKQLSNLQMSFFRFGWKADYDDADNLIYTLFHGTSTAGCNLTGYYNPQVDKVLDESRAEYSDETARLKLLRRAEEMIVDDAPCLWLFQKKTTILLGKDVRDFQVDSLGMIDWYAAGLASSSPQGD